MPKVSIIIAVLNGITTIGKAIESAQVQTEKDIEIVVVDDGSTDGTVEFVRSLAEKDSRIKLIKLEKNIGAPAATNVAIEQAAGEWISILDADDWFERPRIEVFLKAAKQYDADVVCDNLAIFDHALNEIVETTQYGPKDHVMLLNAETYFRRDNPLRRHSIGYTKPVVKKKFLADHTIAYRADHRFGYDFIFMTEILLNGGKAIIVPGAYYVYVHRISPTTRKQSPHSRSESGHTLILRGCDELLVKYDRTMTAPSARRLGKDVIFSRAACGARLCSMPYGKSRSVGPQRYCSAIRSSWCWSA